ncbi:MAG: biopolymer transporter ExbD [Candidatus Cloacimonetes bacterium]|jgi:biopolymer transport protein ExbD|nr:biopolymer transporter ExbD [Candidatus Cloacimonadota bacterium]NLO44243.1 biopolymer transporter ExbD [Candidatus Cloacimonadota bacterium]
MKLKSKRKSISSTMLISMTDVVFLLIIFLLLVSNFSSQSGLPIKLPVSNTSSRHTLQNIEINIYKNGNIYYNDKLMNIKELSDILSSSFSDENSIVRISAEADIAFQRVIDIMDVVKASGFDKIFVATENVSK